MNPLRFRLPMPLLLGLLALSAHGQAVPAAASDPSLGFEVPTVGGTLNYSLSLSESLSKGFYNNSQIAASTNFSGNVGLVTASQRNPFSLIYSGGYLIGNANQPSTYFQSLAASQVLTAGRWNMVVSDGISYLPQTASSGLSGLPGAGDVGIPIQVGDPGLGILTNYGPRVSNTLSASASHPITGSLAFQATGIFTILRFVGDTAGTSATTGTTANGGVTDGLNSTSEGGSAGLNYRIDARQNAGVNVNYTRFSVDPAFTFNTVGVTGFYSRQWTRRFSTNVSAGPLRSSSNAPGSSSAVSLSATAGLSYVARHTTSSLLYSRGINAGSGVVTGAQSDSLIGTVGGRLGRAWGLSGSLGYARTKSLPGLTLGPIFSSNGVTATGQVSRALGRNFSTFGAYTLQHQSLENSGAAVNAFGGLYQTFSFGLTYSPRSISLGHL